MYPSGDVQKRMNSGSSIVFTADKRSQGESRCYKLQVEMHTASTTTLMIMLACFFLSTSISTTAAFRSTALLSESRTKIVLLSGQQRQHRGGASSSSSTLFSSSSSSGASIDNDVTTEMITTEFQCPQPRQDCWRPTINDVERISWGKPASKQGKRTGSRGVPHRLNTDERLLFDQARRKGFLEVVGPSGWRSQRRDAPLLNTYRSLCDARGQVSIVLFKKNTGIDELSIDLSPLRTPHMFDTISKECNDLVVGQDDEKKVPYDEDPKDGDEEVAQENRYLWDSIVDQEGIDDDEEGSVDSNANDEKKGDDDPWGTRPIYQLSPYCISWELPRSDAKSLGKLLASKFHTIEEKATKSSSKKPIHIKPGKNRRSGGYGIG